MNKVVLISTSNGLNITQEPIITELINILSSFKIEAILSKSLYSKDNIYSLPPKERAAELMKYYKNPTIEMIFDVSGGDLANEILEYLDFEVIKNNPKIFVGYSDLSVIINALYSKANTTSLLYQIRHIVKNSDNRQRFKDFISGNNRELLNFKYKFIQGKPFKGIVVGGNIRCSLKLAGTTFMPNFKNKILLLESLGGDVGKMRTYLTQLKLIGAFNELKGIILGTFTEMEKNNLSPTIEELVLEIVNNPSLPVIKTYEIGHGNDSKAIFIGKEIEIL